MARAARAVLTPGKVPGGPAVLRDTHRAMPSENFEIARRGWEAWDRGDPEEATKAFAEDVDWDVSRDIWGDVVGGGHYRGIQGVTDWLRDLNEAWESMEIRSEEQIEAGEQVITVMSARGRGRVSGIEVEHHPAGLSTFREGKIVRVEWFPTRDEALQAAGRHEQS